MNTSREETVESAKTTAEDEARAATDQHRTGREEMANGDAGSTADDSIVESESPLSRRSALRGIGGAAALGFVGLPSVTGSALAQSAGSVSYAPSDWSPAGPPVRSVGTSPTGALALKWGYRNLFGATWNYTTPVQATGEITFDWTFSGYHSNFRSEAKATVLAGGPSGVTRTVVSRQTSRFNDSGSTTVQVNAGYRFGVEIYGYHYDSARRMYGTFTLAPQIIDLDVDVKPDSDDNPINLPSKGNIPVVVYSTPDFDATSLDVSTLRFGAPVSVDNGDGARAAHAGHVEDVDGDGLADLVLHFPTGDTGFQDGDTEAKLVGETNDGTAAAGTDSITIVGSPSNGPSQ